MASLRFSGMDLAACGNAKLTSVIPEKIAAYKFPINLFPQRVGTSPWIVTALLFNLCFQSIYFPNEWGRTLIKPHPRKDCKGLLRTLLKFALSEGIFRPKKWLKCSPRLVARATTNFGRLRYFATGFAM